MDINKEIFYIDRKTNKQKTEAVPSGRFMKYLYGNSVFGKLLLHQLFKRKFISSFVGKYMSSFLSRNRIERFVKEYDMDLSDYQIPNNGFVSFNDFFYRKLKDDKRTIEEGIVSPADGKILVFPSIKNVDEFFVKGIGFSVQDFLVDKNIVDKYKDGSMAIIRLAPVDYHRYHFHVSGKVTKNRKIKGYLYSVSPIALQKNLQIFCENKREYVEVLTEKYGDTLICDVGATMTGSIIQTFKENTTISKGDEKGYFAFGGSTLVLFFEKGKMQFSQDLIKNTTNNLETTVKMGEQIGF